MLPLFATFNHSDTGFSKFRIRTNDYEVGTSKYWGIKDVTVSISKCHATCTTCYGPNSTNCNTCSGAHMIAINGTCVCDRANGYYLNNSACMYECPTSPMKYMDDLSRSCVFNGSCSFPNLYGMPPTGKCVQACPDHLSTKYFASDVNWLCVTDCTTVGQWSFEGANNSCYFICPNNYVAALTGKCETKCPDGSYRLIENNTTNPKCSLTCTTGYSFAGDNICVAACPVGYFVSGSACVQICPTGFFGNTLDWACTNACPTGYFGLNGTWMCVSSKVFFEYRLPQFTV